MNAVLRVFANRPAVLAVMVGLLSLAASVFVADMTVGGSPPVKIRELPPAIHDEYSYLFQAKTLLAGRLSFPSHPTSPELFNQMHVLNEGRFASRYYPGTGAWIAPFLAVGHPRWAHWLAGSLTAMLVFAAGHELGGAFVGFVTGALTAVSPGMALFSNLLLAHHPTVLGLMLFVFAFLRMVRTGSWKDASLAGMGLWFAMLCRPLTAAGVGLPFGVWFLLSLWRGDSSGSGNRERAKVALALCAPVVIGLAVTCFYNHAITGDWRKSPFQLYTDVYTPRHVYGFNNVVRGEGQLGPKVLDDYDGWAKNLTPELALRNVERRFMACWQWTLGIVPLAMALPLFVFQAYRTDRRWRLVPAAIVSLHAVHVPCWFDGIMGWHYVFESGPLWLLMVAGATHYLVQGWRAERRVLLPCWWGAMIVAALLVSYTSARPLWTKSRLQNGVDQCWGIAQRNKRLHDVVDRDVGVRPALVLVPSDPAELHSSFVVNDPDLKAEILYGWLPPAEEDVADVLRLFPRRACYVYRTTKRRCDLLGSGVMTTASGNGARP